MIQNHRARSPLSAECGDERKACDARHSKQLTVSSACHRMWCVHVVCVYVYAVCVCVCVCVRACFVQAFARRQMENVIKCGMGKNTDKRKLRKEKKTSCEVV